MCIHDLKEGSSRRLPIDELKDKVLTPFNCDSPEKFPTSECDPDLQFFNTFYDGLTNCNCYNEATCNDKCKQRIDSDNKFCLIHLNVRSAAEN